MRIKLLKTVLALAMLSPFLAACDNYAKEEREKTNKLNEYNSQFNEEFGPIDPNHDWSVATRVTADIDLSNAPEGEYEVRIFASPKYGGYLLKKTVLNHSEKVSFDAILGDSSVFIQARKTTALGLKAINGQFDVENGWVNTERTADASKTCNTTVGEIINDMGTIRETPAGTSVFHAEVVDPNPYPEGNVYSSIQSMYKHDGMVLYTKIDGENYTNTFNGRYRVTYTPLTIKDGQYVPALSTVTEDIPMTEIDKTVFKSIDGTETGHLSFIQDKRYELWYYVPGKRINNWQPEWKAEWNSNPTGYNDNGQPFKWIDEDYTVPTEYNGWNAKEKTGTGHPAYYSMADVAIKETYGGQFFRLNNIALETNRHAPGNDYLASLTSTYFMEGRDNRALLPDKIQQDMQLVLTENGPVSLTQVVTGSINHNQVGYFYWFEDEGMSQAQKKAARINAPRYICMENTATGKGRNCHLAFFGRNYNEQQGSFVFPKGTHLEFFILTGKDAVAGNRGKGLYYASRDLNLSEGVNNKAWKATSTSNADDAIPEVAALYYNYKGNLAIGFEDGTDMDMNDIIFFLSAPVEAPAEMTDFTEKQMSWTVVCEMVVDALDYDFNDVVLDLCITETEQNSTTDGSNTTGLYLRPLATGNTKASHIYWNTNRDPNGTPNWKYVGETHDLLQKGTSNKIPLNVVRGVIVPFDPDNRIKLCELNDIGEWTTGETSLREAVITKIVRNRLKIVEDVESPNLEGIRLLTQGMKDNTNESPQMLLLPRGWRWPVESVFITKVYPQFINWVENKNWDGWTILPQELEGTVIYYENPLR